MVYKYDTHHWPAWITTLLFCSESLLILSLWNTNVKNKLLLYCVKRRGPSPAALEVWIWLRVLFSEVACNWQFAELLFCVCEPKRIWGKTIESTCFFPSLLLFAKIAHQACCRVNIYMSVYNCICLKFLLHATSRNYAQRVWEKNNIILESM